MKLKQLVLMGGLVALFTHTHTQAQEPKWGLHNSVIDYTQNQTSPLPNIPNPEYTQNAVWDPNGNIVIYESDGVIYNKTGGVILDMNLIIGDIYNIPTPQIGFTEFIFVPVPKSCNEYYGITTYSNGVVFNNYISDIVWCKINVNSGTAITLPQTGFKLAKERISCTTREARTESKLDYQMHIEISQDQGGFRYLFASNNSCVSVLNVDNEGVSFVDGYQTGGSFIPNFRSEMEVYQDGDIFEVAMHSFKNPGQNPTNSLSIFTFNMGGSTPVISHYKVAIPGEPSQQRLIKGLEFSKDGLTLYATITTISSSNIIAGDNIIYFERSSLTDPMAYNTNLGGVIASGATTQDFGLGMLEKGIDGKLWIVGNNKLATLADFDNPQSQFIPNFMVIANALTLAPSYNHHPNGGTPTAEDIIYRKMYLMIDQVDGEDYSQWIFGNDLYPSVVSSCMFPFNFSIPMNTGVSYFPQPAGMNGGGWVSIPHPGSLELIYNKGTACESVEIVKFIEEEERYCPADFDYALGLGEVISNQVEVSSECGEMIDVLHSYYLYVKDAQGNWVYVDACANPSCTLSPINIGHQYKITHIVQNLNSNCHALETTSIIFNY